MYQRLHSFLRHLCRTEVVALQLSSTIISHHMYSWNYCPYTKRKKQISVYLKFVDKCLLRELSSDVQTAVDGTIRHHRISFKCISKKSHFQSERFNFQKSPASSTSMFDFFVSGRAEIINKGPVQAQLSSGQNIREKAPQLSYSNFVFPV